MIDDNWNDFKVFVKDMRTLLSKVQKDQGGNSVSVSINMIDLSCDDWIEVNPYSVNLHTGKGTIKRLGDYLFDVDIKHLLLTQRFEVSKGAE